MHRRTFLFSLAAALAAFIDIKNPQPLGGYIDDTLFFYEFYERVLSDDEIDWLYESYE